MTGPGGAKEGFVYLYTNQRWGSQTTESAVMSTNISFPSESSKYYYCFYFARLLVDR